MPLYEYRCKRCGSVYDVFHKGRELVEDIFCPSCESKSYTKLMSAPHVAMKTSAAPAPSCDTGSCCGGACEID